jgi:hypothetical protein
MPPRFHIKIIGDIEGLTAQYLTNHTEAEARSRYGPVVEMVYELIGNFNFEGISSVEIETYIKQGVRSFGLQEKFRGIYHKYFIEDYTLEKEKRKKKIMVKWRSYHKDTGDPFMLSSYLEIPRSPDGYWVYRGKIFAVSGANLLGIPMPEVILHIKHLVLKQDHSLTRIEKEVDAYQNMAVAAAARREPISEAVRLFVWQRDMGKCVKCGSNERLEFDHIIPIAKGGSSTERNIQLLCEKCNRAKSTNF